MLVGGKLTKSRPLTEQMLEAFDRAVDKAFLAGDYARVEALLAVAQMQLAEVKRS